MGYLSYHDLSTVPVRELPIPKPWEDPDEAEVYHMLVALWAVGQGRREARRRIVAAFAHRADSEKPMRRERERDSLREAIKLGAAMAQSEARRMLALKTQQVLAAQRSEDRVSPPSIPGAETPPLAPDN